MIKKIVRIAGISIAAIVAFVSGIAFFIHRQTGPIVAVADRFIAEITSGDAKAAHAMMTEEAKAATSAPAFEQMVANANLKGLRNVSWSKRSWRIEKGVGSGLTEGSAELASGRKIDIRIEFAAFDDVWKIKYFNARAKN
ncbi:MAG: hypothetical protein ACRCTD_14655 [Beijerinckiaceae bacterium]